MAGVRLDKAWQPLTAEAVAAVGGTLGVYELADADRRMVLVAYAGGRSLFGLRGELERHLAAGTARWFRVEVTTAYLSRWHELLMAHLHDHGRLPALNGEDPARLGRLSPS